MIVGSAMTASRTLPFTAFSPLPVWKTLARRGPLRTMPRKPTTTEGMPARIFHTGNGLNALNGSVLLAIMALPTIISISEDSLNAVPKAYNEASLALGASRWQTLLRVKIPAGLSGIIAAIMLGMGRAIGETMTVLMATGNARAFPHGFLDSVRTMTSGIAIELGEVPYYTTHYYALFAIGLVLFVMTFAVNLVADVVLNKYQEREQ